MGKSVDDTGQVTCAHVGNDDAQQRFEPPLPQRVGSLQQMLRHGEDSGAKRRQHEGERGDTTANPIPGEREGKTDVEHGEEELTDPASRGKEHRI